MDWQPTLMIALKQAINGVFNALAASLLLLLWHLARRGAQGAEAVRPSLSSIVFHAMLPVTLLAGIAPIIYESYTQRSEQEAFIAERLNDRAFELANRLETDALQGQTRYDYHLSRVQTRDDLGLAIVSAEGQVAASVGNVPIGHNHIEAGSIERQGHGLSIWLPGGSMSAVARWGQGAYFLSLPVPAVAEIDRVYAQLPAAPLVRALEAQRVKLFALLAAIIGLAILASAGLSRAISRPLRQLDSASTALGAQIAAGQMPVLPGSVIQEYDAMAHTLSEMSRQLSTSFDQQAQAQTKLEAQVEERTQSLRESERRFRDSAHRLGLATEAARLGIWDLDMVTNQLQWDAGMFRIYGKVERDFGHSVDDWAEAVLPEDLERANADIADGIANPGVPYESEFRIQLPGGEIRHVRAITQAIAGPKGLVERVIGINEDISERKQMERMKSEFVSTVSHELRTPLTSISGALGLVVGRGIDELPVEIRQMINIAHNNSQRLSQLINDLLDIGKLSAGKLHFELQVQPLMPLIEQSLENHKPFGLEQQVQLMLDNPAFAPEVRVDGQRLQQVLANLLSNAIKFSPEGATVSVSVQTEGEQVRVSVTDQGSGVPLAFRSRIFDKFSQADASDTRQKGGTGLGLAITRELLERMDGRIDFDSVEGEGTTFWFELPLIDASIDWLAKPINEGRLLESIETAVNTSSITHPRILHVEDDVDLHQVVRAMLGGRYDCDLVTTLRDARDLIELERFDVVILDIGLPDGSGWDLLEELRAQQPWIRVFILSGNDLATEQSHKVESVLLKSRISPQKLLETLDKQVNSIRKRP